MFIAIKSRNQFAGKIEQNGFCIYKTILRNLGRTKMNSTVQIKKQIFAFFYLIFLF